MAGPEVMRTLTPISLAMMPDRVVLPSPGGPWSRTWSSGSFRILAAWMNTSRLPLAFSWPMYSRRVLGRREYSPSSSRVREVVTRGSRSSFSYSVPEKSIDNASLLLPNQFPSQYRPFSGRFPFICSVENPEEPGQPFRTVRSAPTAYRKSRLKTMLPPRCRGASSLPHPPERASPPTAFPSELKKE